MRRLPSRQVHLDFHTSEHIPGIGSQFDKKQFQYALKTGHVNSITIFGKCHHGYFYYPTEVGTVHPGLESGRDLAGEMMDACHEIGVYAPLYLTMGWSALDAIEHPEWIARKKDGSYSAANYDFAAQDDTPRPETSWVHLCTAGSYREYLYKMTEEACLRYHNLDGLFFDIVVSFKACYCDHCIKGMRKMGLNPASEQDAKAYWQLQKKLTLDGLREILFRHHPDASIFFNGCAEIYNPQWHYASTHFEMEDLPTTWGGYDKMPMRARYFSRSGKDYLGMTGKFHRSWGEFGGYKTPEALKYECSAMLANGARISVGDQLHPSGKMDLSTYRNIGEAFAYAEQIEDYCFDTEETARLGVIISKEPSRNEGIAKLLLDCQLDFDIVHDEADLLRFDTVILPDNCRLNESLGKAFDTFTKQGGKVLMLGGSGLKEDAEEFAFAVPFTYRGKSSCDKDYFELNQEWTPRCECHHKIQTHGGSCLPEDIVTSPILCYTGAHIVELTAASDAEIFSRVREPYFNRTYGHYCSHANTPYREEAADYPGAVRSGNILYVAHELAAMYHNYGVTYHRRYFKWLLRQLYQADCVEVDMPCMGRIHLIKRAAHQQYVLHLLYASPVHRGNSQHPRDNISVLEDFPTLRNIEVKLRLPETIKKAVLIPQNQELPIEITEDGCCLTIPELAIHQMVVFSYEV